MSRVLLIRVEFPNHFTSSEAQVIVDSLNATFHKSRYFGSCKAYISRPNVTPLEKTSLDKLFHKMTFVPEILANQSDYDKETELFGHAWEEVLSMRKELEELRKQVQP